MAQHAIPISPHPETWQDSAGPMKPRDRHHIHMVALIIDDTGLPEARS
jgi:hypothetical protein